jgi:hypothetical protein
MPTVSTLWDVSVVQPNGDKSQLTICLLSPNERQADSLREQFARDLAEARAARAELDAEADDRRALERERDDAVRRQDRDELSARTSKPDAPGVSEHQRGSDDPESDSNEPDQPEIDR